MSEEKWVFIGVLVLAVLWAIGNCLAAWAEIRQSPTFHKRQQRANRNALRGRSSGKEDGDG